MVNINMNKGIHKPYIMFQTEDIRLVHASPNRIVFEAKTRDSIGVPKWNEVASENSLLNPELVNLLIKMGQEMQQLIKVNEEQSAQVFSCQTQMDELKYQLEKGKGK